MRLADRFPSMGECREILGKSPFEDLEAQMVDLPDGIDRDAVYRVIAEGAYIREAYLAFNPAWCRRRDKALEEIGQAIDRFKAVLRDSSSPRVRSAASAAVEAWAGGLEREYRRLKSAPEAGFLRLTLERVGWVGPRPKGGRTPAAWRKRTEDELQRLGVAKLKAEALLGAAGLTAERKDPTLANSK